MKALRTLRLAGIFACATATAACGVMEEKKPPPPCPPIFVLKDAGTLRVYKPGPGRDLTDVVMEGQISDFRAVCEYSKDRSKADVALSIVFEATRGPAATDRKLSFEYFIAIPKFHPAPAGKKTFTVTGEFPENTSRLRTADEVRLQIPFVSGEPLEDYAVYLGFQLTHEQLEDNQRGSR
jgi:hypothetical protein